MFTMVPYGALANVTCTHSSKTGKVIINRTSSTSYSTQTGEIGLNGAYFLECLNEPTEMTYQYTSGNGILVDIETNLEVKNRNFGANGSGSFTISNEQWFNNGKQGEPYIRLCFNSVQVECCFTNPWNGQGGNYCDNGWSSLQYTSNETRLKVMSKAAQNYCILARYITVSWNQSEQNQLFFSQYKNDGHWYQIWFSYGASNGSIQEFSSSRRLWSHDQTGAQSPTYTVTIPALNGHGGSIGGVTPVYYFKIGYTVNFHGESSWQRSSTLYLSKNTTQTVFNDEGFIYNQTLTAQTNVESTNSSPNTYSHPATNIWSGNSKFYKLSTGEYVSPASGLQINSYWTIDSNACVPHCYCNAECNCDTQCTCEGCYGACSCDGQCSSNNPSGGTMSGCKNKYYYGSKSDIQNNQVTGIWSGDDSMRIVDSYTHGNGDVYYKGSANGNPWFWEGNINVS